jgi:hypothetical protein
MLWGVNAVTSLVGTHTNHVIDTFLDQQTGAPNAFAK